MRKNPRKPEEEFEVGQIVSPKDVPNWSRRQKKWQDLVDQILALEPRKVLTIHFQTMAVADRARNHVRDEINRMAGAAVLKTHAVPDDVENEEGPTTVYFEKRSVEEAKANQRDT